MWIIFTLDFASYWLIFYPRKCCISLCLPCLLKIFWFLSSEFCWKIKPFLSVLCANVKSVVSLVYLLKPCSFGSVLSHSFLLVLFFLNEISLWACVFLFHLFTQWFLLSSLVELCWINHVLIWFFDILWTTNVFCHTLFAFLFLLVFCPNYVFFGSWKSRACMFTKCIFYIMSCFLRSNI